MSEWIAAAPALLVGALLITLPGLPTAWALRLTGLPLIAASIAASFAVIAISSLIAPLAGIAWSAAPVLIVAAVFAAIAIGLRRFIPAAGRGSPASDAGSTGPTARVVMGFTVGALVLSALLIGQELTRAIGDPENISQTYDGVFHLNAVAHILSTGDASPLHMNLAYPDRDILLYPTLWHATAALVAQLTGAGVAVATNALALAVAVWVWPVAILFFAAPFFVRRPSHLLLGGVLASVFSAFPYLLLAWGVLYPNFLSTALLPVAFGAMHRALKHRRLSDSPLIGGRQPITSLWIVVVGAGGAAILAHPNALFGLAALSAPLLVATGLDVRASQRTRRGKRLRLLGIGIALSAIIVLWVTISAGESRRYDSSLLRGAASALSNAPLVDAKAWFLTILVLGGAGLLLIRRRHRWLIASYAISVALFAVTVGLEGPLRDFLTGAWYNDAARLAALLPIAALPLAAAAGALLLDGIADRMETRWSWIIAVGATLALILVGARGGSISAQSGWIGQLYQVSPESPLLSPDELALLDRLDRDVPEGSLIAGDPWTGTALAFALADRAVLFPHLKGDFGPEATELAAQLRDLDRAGACTLLDGLGVDFVLDFDGPVYDSGNSAASDGFAGMRDVGGSPALDLVDSEGAASLYTVSC